jgi:hypothetical protein
VRIIVPFECHADVVLEELDGGSHVGHCQTNERDPSGTTPAGGFQI